MGAAHAPRARGGRASLVRRSSGPERSARARMFAESPRASLRSKTATCAGQEPDREWITRCAEGTRAGESSVRACGARSNSERLRRQGTARSGMAQAQLGLYTFFSNIFENIEGPAHFRIREYSREYRCRGRLFSQEYTSFLQPLTLVDLESQDILEYSRCYNRGV